MNDEPVGGQRGPSLVFGTLLIVVGGLWLASQVFDFEILSSTWPFFIILPGLAVVLSALASRNPAALGAAIPGSIVTIIGLLLLYQATTGHWESWAYGWALVAPGGVGLAMVLTGLRTGEAGVVEGGRTTLVVGLVFFAIGFVFFELILGISGRDFGVAGDLLVPALLIGLGAYFLVRPR